MDFAALVGLALGVSGGLAIGTRVFKHVDTGNLRYLDQSADKDDEVPEPSGGPVDKIRTHVHDWLPYLPAWTSEPDFDQADWLNDAIAIVWPNVSRAIHRMAMETLEPMLEDYKTKLPFLEALVIELLDLGTVPLTLGGVKMVNTRDDEVILETRVLWGSTAKVHASALLRVGPASVYVPLKVENLTLQTRMRFTFRPLVETLPCIGAVSISMLDSPYVDGIVKAILDHDLMVIPFLHRAVCVAVKKVCDGICVYPCHIDVPIMENSGIQKPLAGMLEVTIQGIEHLKGSGDLLGKGDPMVEFSLVHYDDNGRIVKRGPVYSTEVLKNTHNPTFDESFTMVIDEFGKNWEVQFVVLDYDAMGSHDPMAQYGLALDDSPEAEHHFLREPRKECDMVFSLNAPEKEDGPLKQPASKLKSITSLHKPPKEGESFGELHVRARYMPFVTPKGPEDSAHDTAKEAMEKTKRREEKNKTTAEMKGILSVNIERCKDLALVGGDCDPFIELKLYDPEKEHPIVRRTELITNDPSPRFRQKFDFVFVSATSRLVATVYDKSGLFNVIRRKKDTPLGKVHVPVKEVVKAGRIKDQFALTEADQGELHMTLVWQPVESMDQD